MAKVKVIVRFRDKIDHKTWYEVGKEVEFTDEARVKDLVAKGWVKVVEEAPKQPLKETVSAFGKELDRASVMEALKKVGEAVHHSLGVVKIEETIAKLSDEKKVALKAALGIEEAAKNVVELIDGKVIEIVANEDGTLIAYGEDNGEKVPLASGEYEATSRVYVIGEEGRVIEEREVTE